MQMQTAVLRDEKTANGSRSVSARIAPEGELIVEGHDLGKGVDSLLGYREYEWTITIAAADTPKLLHALNGNGVSGLLRRRRTLLDALRSRFSNDRANGLEPFLKERGIPYAFWNRVGD